MSWLQHVGITCSDLKKSEKFYIENFGLERLWETRVKISEIKQIFGIDSPAHIVALKAENSMIELFEFAEDKGLKPSMGSITHFALFVGNRRESYERLKTKGVEVILIDRGDGRFTYFIKDPDGNLIELRE